MKTSIRVITAAAICLVAQSSFAQYKTFGVPDCGEWITEKTLPRKTWVLGYLTGLNIAGNAKEDVLGEISSTAQIYAWMDNYCGQNPLDTVLQGSNKLFYELMKKAKARQ